MKKAAAGASPDFTAELSAPETATGERLALRRTRTSSPSLRKLAWPGLRGAALPILLLIVWELVVDSGLVPAHRLPAPSQVASTLLQLSRHGLLGHIGTSLVRVLAGFTAGSLVALVAGSLVGANRRVAAYLDPLLQGLRAIPSLAWVPLLLLWLGIDEAPKISLIAIGAFFPVYLNLSAGIRGIDRRQVEVGVLYGLSPMALIRRVYIPAALPELFTGLRAGLGLSWMFLVAAELIAATRGVGYLLSDGRETGRPDVVIAAIILFGILGKITDDVLRLIERRSLRWRDTHPKATSE